MKKEVGLDLFQQIQANRPKDDLMLSTSSVYDFSRIPSFGRTSTQRKEPQLLVD
jgi:hypothetical protein